MIIKQLIPGLGKLMKETTSVLWVDLGYKLRSWRGFHCRIPEGWLIPCPVYMLHMLHVLLYMLPDYLARGPGSMPGV